MAYVVTEDQVCAALRKHLAGEYQYLKRNLCIGNLRIGNLRLPLTVPLNL
jgi:hypothetical protein